MGRVTTRVRRTRLDVVTGGPGSSAPTPSPSRSRWRSGSTATSLTIDDAHPRRRLRPRDRLPAHRGMLHSARRGRPRSCTAPTSTRTARPPTTSSTSPWPRRAALHRPARERTVHLERLRGVRHGQHRRGAHQQPVCRGRGPASPSHPTVLAGLPDALRERQPVFDRTGGLHAAGLFTADGELLVRARGRRAAQRRRQGHRLGRGRGREPPPDRAPAGRERPGQLRAHPEGERGRDPGRSWRCRRRRRWRSSWPTDAGMTLVGVRAASAR